MKAHLLLPLATLALAAGCAVGPNYRPPSTPMPASFQSSGALATNSPAGALAEWWRTFNDPQLDALIDQAASANLDVRAAAARVREARALRGVTTAALFPQIGVNGSYARNRLSENTRAGQQLTAVGQPLADDLYSASLDMNWELDLFGGTRRANEAASAALAASVEAGRSVSVSVLAEVGMSYLDLRGAQKQLAVARENLETQQRTLALTRDRRQSGLASELDTARAESLVAATQAEMAPLEAAIVRARNRLAVLLGKSPQEFADQLAVAAPIPAAVPGVPVGLPSDLLRQRPDIRQAERELGAATARVGVATAELFPRFTLTGLAGVQSVAASDWFSGGSRFWTLGPSLRWPIFSAGKIRQAIRVENARQDQAALRYEQTVLTALEEVENALVAFGKEQERHRALTESERATRRAVTLADDRYRGGLVDFLNVLEAQRSLLSVQGQLVESERRLCQNLVRLYKSLGGGWNVSVDPPLWASVGENSTTR